jgi:hypothetical protein
MQMQQQHEDKLKDILRKRELAELRKKELDGHERAEREHTVRQQTQEELRMVFSNFISSERIGNGEFIRHGDPIAQGPASRSPSTESPCNFCDHSVFISQMERLLANKTKADAEKSEQIRVLLEDANRERSSLSRENQLSSKQEVAFQQACSHCPDFRAEAKRCRNSTIGRRNVCYATEYGSARG